MSSDAVIGIDLDGKLQKLASGKVRELFAIDDNSLLFVSTDRISAYDVVMANGIPDKGALLTQMSIYWFRYLTSQIPNLRTHYLSSDLPSTIPSSPSLKTRSMTVRRLQIFPLESIVRGYITGSAWTEYKTRGTVHTIPLPAGLTEGQKLLQPLWTPSTKAEQGAKDENISPDAARAIVGEEAAREIERLSLEIYKTAAERTQAVGIILADTKFEFGFDPAAPSDIVLVDEVLTPDSSRFWPVESWERDLGGQQKSFDKQFLRDWLCEEGLRGVEGVRVPEEVVRRTGEKYREAFERITGEKWES